MIFSVLHYLRGFLVLELEGAYLERFINLCVRRGIYLWHIKKVDGEKARIHVSIPGFFRMREAARKTKTRVHILQKRGMPLFLHKHRKRRAFIVGILLFILILTLLSSFIWRIEIDGFEKTDENIIRNALGTCGLEEGVIKYTLKASDIKEEMLRKMPELSWLWVEIKGTRAFVHVREKTPKPEIVPQKRPSNVVAETDGVILDCTATRGTPCVKEGDAVQKGTLLISGTVETKHGGTLLVHAEGAVRAQTFRRESGTFPLSSLVETDRGGKAVRYTLCVGEHLLPLYRKGDPFPSSRTETEKKELCLFGRIYLPLAIEKSTFYETNTHKVLLSPEEAAALYGPRLREKIQIPADAEVLNTEYTHILNEDGSVTVSCTVTCIEEIGEIREILEETEDDGKIF